MGKEKKAKKLKKLKHGSTSGSSSRATISGTNAKDRHNKERKYRAIDWNVPAPADLVARLEAPKSKSKHKSWLEFVENPDKKKKLEYQYTPNTEPPPGYEYVPYGNPLLTQLCKELSREQEAMMFIVTTDRSHGLTHRQDVGIELGRRGYHFRQSIVDLARARLELGDSYIPGHPSGPSRIPQTQEEINEEADAAIRELFPRIPNTDRQEVIDRAFSMANNNVGIATNTTLPTRVQLAVLAHIRHNYTRYDELLRQASWSDARKAVEPLCFDYLVKWRGDEENGRDQLDEILREFVVISDSESMDGGDDDEDEDKENEEDDDSSYEPSLGDPMESVVSGTISGDLASSQKCLNAAELANYRVTALPENQPYSPTRGSIRAGIDVPICSGNNDKRANRAARRLQKRVQHQARRETKSALRGFKRYQAVRDLWHDAVERRRHDSGRSSSPVTAHQSGQPSRTAIGLVNSAKDSLPLQAVSGYSGTTASTLNGLQAMPRGQNSPRRGSSSPYSPSLGTPTLGAGPSGAPAPANNCTYSRTPDHGGEPLRDFLVKSIEPDSLETGRTLPPFAHGHGVSRGSPFDHRLYPGEDFIQLSPRNQRSFVETRLHPEQSRPHAPYRSADGFSQAYSPAIRPHGSVAEAHAEPTRRFYTAKGTESNPIVLTSSPLLSSYAEAPVITRSGPPVRGSHTDSRNGDFINCRARSFTPPTTRRLESSNEQQMSHPLHVGLADRSDFVRVSNVFPRRHEAQAALRLAPSPRFNPQPAHQVAVGQVSNRLPVSTFSSDYIPSPPQYNSAYTDHQRREEHVIGIEYVPIEPRFEQGRYQSSGIHHSDREVYSGYRPPAPVPLQRSGSWHNLYNMPAPESHIIRPAAPSRTDSRGPGDYHSR